MEPDRVKLKEIKPVLTGYIRKSRILLQRNAVPDEDAVHDIRVLMKKSRAVLRLTCPLLENEFHDKDIQSLKRVGQIMSELRDTSVHRKTLRELKKEFPEIFSKLSVNEKILMLMKKPEFISEPGDIMKNSLEEIDVLLNKTGYRIRFHQMHQINPVALLSQLEISFNVVRNIYLECRNLPKPEKIHKFRKRSKDFLYQLYFFRPLNPAKVKSIERRVERMTLNLGRYNDLYQLIRIIGYVYPDEANLPAMDELVIKIHEKQDSYLSKVWTTAYNCFCPGTNLVNLLGFKLLVI
jgi:CHAD domain-containing protein